MIPVRSKQQVTLIGQFPVERMNEVILLKNMEIKNLFSPEFVFVWFKYVNLF